MDDLPFLKGSWSIRKVSLSNGEKDFEVSGPVCLNINGARWTLNLMSNDAHTVTKFISPIPELFTTQIEPIMKTEMKYISWRCFAFVKLE